MSAEREDSLEPEPLLGRVIAGKLELVELLGKGAMGKVFRAHHDALDKTVAIKVLHSVAGQEKQRAGRFKAEARAASRIDHPHTVQILDFGEDGDDKLLYIAMEYLEGCDLQAFLHDNGPANVGVVCRVMIQTLSALAAAHDKGVIHRDMKPGNIMLVKKDTEEGPIDDFVKVCDFGLAKIHNTDGTPYEATTGPLTQQGAIFGTPAYMSPEQARGEALDARSDLYSCGVIMYKMATGRTPFPAETPWGVLMRHMNEPPPAPHSIYPSIDRELEQVILHSMIKDKETRYQSARQMRRVLIELLQSKAGALPAGAVGHGGLAGVIPPSISSLHDRKSAAQINAFIASGSAASASDVGGVMPASGLEDTLVRDEANAASLLVDPYAATGPAPEAPRTGARLFVVAVVTVAVAIVGLIGYVASRSDGIESRQLVVSTLPRLPRPPPAEAVPTPAEATPKEPEPVAEAEPPAEPMAEPPVAETTRRKPERPVRRPAATTVAKPVEPPPAAKPAPEPVAEVEPPAPEVEPPAPKPPAPPPAVKPAITQVPPPAEPAPPAPAPMGPTKLPSNFALAVTLDDVDVFGGMSRTKTQRALERVLSEAQACLRKAVAAKGVEASGQVAVEARIDLRGRIRDAKASGSPSGAKACVEGAFSGARLPRPDTGDARLRFKLGYRTKP